MAEISKNTSYLSYCTLQDIVDNPDAMRTFLFFLMQHAIFCHNRIIRYFSFDWTGAGGVKVESCDMCCEICLH